MRPNTSASMCKMDGTSLATYTAWTPMATSGMKAHRRPDCERPVIRFQPSRLRQRSWRHPKVAECAVIGAPSKERGEIVKAFVVLRGEIAATINCGANYRTMEVPDSAV